MNERKDYPSTLVLGYGNPGRQDDGLGPALADAIEKLERPGVTVDSTYQLNIEDAAAFAEHGRVILVDASCSGPEPYSFERVRAATTIEFTSHAVSPESVLAMCEDHFGRSPEVWLMGVRGYEFEFTDAMTENARANFNEALAFLKNLIEPGKEKLNG